MDIDCINQTHDYVTVIILDEDQRTKARELIVNNTSIVSLDIQKDLICGSLEGSLGQSYNINDIIEKISAFVRHKSLDRWFCRNKTHDVKKRVIIPECIVSEMIGCMVSIHDLIHENRGDDNVQLWIFCESPRDFNSTCNCLKNVTDVTCLDSKHEKRYVPSSCAEDTPQTLDETRDMCNLMVLNKNRERYKKSIFHDDELLFMIYESYPKIFKDNTKVDSHIKLNKMFIDASMLSTGGESSNIFSSQGCPCIDAAYELKQLSLMLTVPELHKSIDKKKWTRSIMLSLTSQRSSLSKHICNNNANKTFAWYERIMKSENKKVASRDNTYDNLYVKTFSAPVAEKKTSRRKS